MIGAVSTPTYTLPTLRTSQVASVATPQDLVTLASAPPSGGAQPKEQSRLSIANQRGIDTAVDWNDKVGTVVGGGLGFGVLIPAIYAGVIGGVIAGGVLGLGLGPASAVLSGAHGLGFVGQIFHAGGLAAKAATVIGTASGAVGGFVVGQKVGRGAAAIPIGMVAYPVGFAQGLATKENPYAETTPAPAPVHPRREKTDAATRGAQAFLGGAGLITGGLGGALLGAGVGSGAALTSGLILHDLSWAALASASSTGAIAGGLALGVVSAAGGYMIATAASNLIKKALHKEG